MNIFPSKQFTNPTHTKYFTVGVTVNMSTVTSKTDTDQIAYKVKLRFH